MLFIDSCSKLCSGLFELSVIQWALGEWNPGSTAYLEVAKIIDPLTLLWHKFYLKSIISYNVSEKGKFEENVSLKLGSASSAHLYPKTYFLCRTNFERALITCSFSLCIKMFQYLRAICFWSNENRLMKEVWKNVIKYHHSEEGNWMNSVLFVR